MADLLGYAASCAVLATFLMRTMLPLRLVAILSNVLFVAYGYVELIYPILFLHLALLPVNFWRLCAHWKDGSAPRPVSVAKAGAARARSTALWFAIGLVLGLMAPLPILLMVGKSEAAKLVLPYKSRATRLESPPSGR